MLIRPVLCGALVLLQSVLALSAHAHFPWLVREADGRVVLFFGEHLAERTYKLPPSIAAAEIRIVNDKGGLDRLDVESMDSAQLVGLRSKDSISPSRCAMTAVTFGVYQGGLLKYYAIRYPAIELAAPGNSTHAVKADDLAATLKGSEGGLSVQVVWKGEPLANVDVKLSQSNGTPSASLKTDEVGRVHFPAGQVASGLNAITVGHKVPMAGTFQEKDYQNVSHYLTATFEVNKPEQGSVSHRALPALPFAITSFGAARVGESIYVYGGHTGDAHAYWHEGQSNKLMRMDLESAKPSWEVIAEGERRQGLGMVGYKNRLILVGGFTAMNKQGEKADLHSQSQVRAFDLDTKQWVELPSLPEPRSSHDVAMVGSTVYVVGGWNMTGGRQTSWHKTAWSMDLDAKDPQWVALPTPPFQRRAVATVEHAGKLFVLGGMTEDGQPTKAVSIYDPSTKTWSEAAPLIGEQEMAGFGASGWSVDGQLLVTTSESDIQAWDDKAGAWKALGKSRDGRFFHRLLPIDSKHLVAIGGANMQSGKFLELEVIANR